MGRRERVRFNSRLPCGSRHVVTILEILDVPFQLTAPLREPTLQNDTSTCNEKFQLTAPLREPTGFHSSVRAFRRGFNSRLPCGSRHSQILEATTVGYVSTHGSLAGADLFSLSNLDRWTVSTHGSLAGADQEWIIVEEEL